MVGRTRNRTRNERCFGSAEDAALRSGRTSSAEYLQADGWLRGAEADCLCFVDRRAGNLQPCAVQLFFGGCSKPPTVLFCPGVRTTTGKSKDTLRNVLATKEFVVNIVSEEIVAEMNQTSAEVGPEVDEFELPG